MKRRKPIAFILSVLMAFSVASFVACNNNDDPFVEKLDPTKTQIYVTTIMRVSARIGCLPPKSNSNKCIRIIRA